MNIYEIDQTIESLINPDTGEILDIDTFIDLQMERETKIENMALWVKNLVAESEAIKAEKNALYEREKAAKNKADSLKKYLSQILMGEKFSTPKVAVSFRKSASVDVDDAFVEWAKNNASHLLKFSEPSVDKTAIKTALTNGKQIPYAKIAENQNIQIK